MVIIFFEILAITNTNWLNSPDCVGILIRGVFQAALLPFTWTDSIWLWYYKDSRGQGLKDSSEMLILKGFKGSRIQGFE